jgi:transcriptional regulator GlxA family with amidase domain
MAYLTGWRLRLAAQALTSSPKGVADIAAAVGYESEAAFNRDFKRAFRVPPAGIDGKAGILRAHHPDRPRG